LDDRPLVVGIDGRELQGRPTGTGRYLRSLLRHFREDHLRLVLYFDGEAPRDPVLDQPHLACRGLGRGETRGLLWQQRLLPAAAKSDRLDAFFAPAYSCPLTLAVPRVTTVHDLSFFSHPQDFTFRDGLRRRLLTALSVRVSAALPVVSDFTAREMAARFPAQADRVIVIPHGPDEDLPVSPPRDEARRMLGAQGPYVITVGAILNRRCLPELLRATARLLRLHPGLVLDVVGENRTHPLLDLDGLVRGLGLERHVRTSGFVDEAGLAARYAAADAAVFLSDYEGFGLPALEAAARGVPLVVSRAPALGEIFGEAALLVDPHDETAVARAVSRLISDATLRDRLALAGRTLATRHSWAEAARSTLHVLRRAAGR
jgi:glycosyltransferase involved in cell wall biosynthesis